MVNKNTFKDIQKWSSKTIAEELFRLREYSEQNNINEVNNSVKSLLSNPGFWILCYESLKSNTINQSSGCSVFDGKAEIIGCLLYTSPSPRDQRGSRMPSSA